MNPERISEQFTKPAFRAEVPITEFEQIEKAKSQLAAFRELMQEHKSAEDIETGAVLLGDLVSSSEQPNEVKLEAFEEQLHSLTREGGERVRAEITKIIIDSIRNEENPAMRMRYAAILATRLEKAELERAIVKENRSYEDVENVVLRRDAFRNIAHADTKEAKGDDARYAAWARYVLEPRDALKVFIELYKKDPNVTFEPKIEEEVVDILEGTAGSTSVEEEGEKLYEKIRLNPQRVYSPAARELWNRVWEREPSLYITRRMGAKYVHLEFPSDLSERIAKEVARFRGEEISRNELWDEASKLLAEYLDRMNDEQRSELTSYIADNNIEVRFGTVKEITIPKQELKPEQEELPEKMQRANAA